MIPLHYVRCKSHYEARVAWWESSGVQLNHSRGEFEVNGASFDTRRQPLIMSWQDFTATARQKRTNVEQCARRESNPGHKHGRLV